MNEPVIHKDGDIYVNLPFLIAAIEETIDYGIETLDTLSPVSKARALDVLDGMSTILGSLKTFNQNA